MRGQSPAQRGCRRKILATLYSQNLREQSNGVQVQGRVEVPAGPLIEYLSFCMAIAEAACPTRAQHYQRSGCIVNKMVTFHLPMAQSAANEKWPFPVEFQAVLVSEGGRTLDQLLTDRPDAHEMSALELPLDPNTRCQVVESSMPYRLNEEDRRALNNILPSLPPLRYPMSDADQTAFLDAWFSLRDRPAWEPVLVTAEYIERNKAAQPAVLAEHQRALQEEFASGRIDALNARHVPVAVLMAGTFIPRQQAIAYLERREFSHVDPDRATDAQRDSQPAVPKAERKQDSKRVAVRTRAQEKSSPAVPRVEALNSKGEESRRGEPTGFNERNAASLPAAGDGNTTVGKIARLPRVEELTGLKRSSIYNRMSMQSKHYDPTFPQSFTLGADGGAVGWNEEEIKAWVAARGAARPR
jgi:predicted DNA-binding transcriptional regulator AlpA